MLLWLVLCLGLRAQTQDTWIQFIETQNFATANEFAIEVSALEPNVKIYRTILGSYAVIIGPMSGPEAQQKANNALEISTSHPDANFLISKGFQYQEEIPTKVAEISPQKTEEKQSQIAENSSPQSPTLGESIDPSNVNNFFEFAPVKKEYTIQLGLKLLGYYEYNIDGILGSGSESAIKAFQRSIQQESTGQLTTEQFTVLLAEIEKRVGFTQLRTAINKELGIKVVVPTGLVEEVEIDFPYIKLKPKTDRNYNIVLFNSRGGKDVLQAFYRGLLVHANIPGANSEITSNRFEIRYSDFEFNFHAKARLFEDRIRGVITYWSTDQSNWASYISELITHSLVESSTQVSESVKDDSKIMRLEKVLEVSNTIEPKKTSSGFFVNSNGAILTSSDGVNDCQRITVDFSQEAEISYLNLDTGLAVLNTQAPITPLSAAVFASNFSVDNSDLILGGYSFGDASKLAIVSIGKGGQRIKQNLSNADFVIQLNTTEEDIGGPLINASGKVAGILKGRTALDKGLPHNLQFGLSSNSIFKDLSEAGINIQIADSKESLEFEQISQIARDITVLVRCY